MASFLWRSPRSVDCRLASSDIYSSKHVVILATKTLACTGIQSIGASVCDFVRKLRPRLFRRSPPAGTASIGASDRSRQLATRFSSRSPRSVLGLLDDLGRRRISTPPTTRAANTQPAQLAADGPPPQPTTWARDDAEAGAAQTTSPPSSPAPGLRAGRRSASPIRTHLTCRSTGEVPSSAHHQR